MEGCDHALRPSESLLVVLHEVRDTRAQFTGISLRHPSVGQVIDRPAYERQRDRLREDIALAELEANDARLEELDVEGILGFAETVISNAARLWSDATLEQKQRLQAVLFPDGLRFDGKKFGTAVTCLAFSRLQRIAGVESGVASPNGKPEGWIATFSGIAA